jgi:hypothetical protein
MSGPNLWWVYDDEGGSFSTLPTGPFLVPALIICGIAALFGAGRTKVATYESKAGDLVNTPEWQAANKRHWKLFRKWADGFPDGISYAERCEMDRLEAYLNNPYRGFKP